MSNLLTRDSLFKLSTRLSTYFGQQVLVARPELKNHWYHNKNIPTTASALSLKTFSEDELASTKPSQIAQLFELFEIPISGVPAQLSQKG